MPPFFQKTVGMAIRAFQHAANQEDHDFKRFAGDYTLFHLGSFDDQVGKFDLKDTPDSLGVASQFVEDE
jgi:hypothetical protein